MIWLAVPIILAALPLVIVLAWFRLLVRKHGLLVVLWRFASGHHLDGVARTDAGWLAKPTRVLHPTGRASWWAHQPRLYRAGYRWAVVALTAGLAVTWLMLTEVEALATSAFAVAALATLGGWRAWRRVAGRRHRKHVERPLAAALAPFLGVTPRAVEAGLTVRRDFADAKGGEHVAAQYLPDHFAGSAEQKARVLDATHNRLGVALKPQWQISQHPARVNFLRAPTPPDKVLLADELAALDSRPDHHVLLGRDEAGELVWWRTDVEDPHVLASAGSRRGKTSLLIAVAAQELARGGEVTAVDPKRLGLLSLAGIQGFRLFNDPRNVPAMWGAVADFRKTIEDRFDQLAADPTLEFPRRMLLLDEMSQLSGMWGNHWQSVKERGDPKTPPVYGDLATAVYMGAQARCHVWIAGQRIDFAILAGLVGSFGCRLLAGFQPQDYQRLVGTRPVMRSAKAKGRFVYFDGNDPTWIQAIFGAPDAWADYARDRIKARDLAQDAGTGTGTGVRDIIGLAAGAAHLGLTAETFKKRLQRQGRPPGEYRVGNQPAWPVADLAAWAGVAVERARIVIPGQVVTDTEPERNTP